ncbi:cobalamin biosynthesis protein CobG [Marinobacter halodurans]|uniref:Cobalamin biosynthesis protein CobG n=1 Tax=Marinobacter halodurans TaxID=2528979 RepID=A0ABY1ZG09_9GAMM|nr:cobalamin biosynthesis protein CobG [Marinobacter halodurans]TBW50350.1 cobalamin biosynthesis protein CobG [Marinobacter halodurans]
MVSEARVKGWCPGAWRPMASGDGLLVRIRPHRGRLTGEQLVAVCRSAEAHGSGLVELTNRANLQLRGISEESWPALMADLADQGLIDPDPATESRRNLMLVPDWQEGDDTDVAARLLTARLADLPELPGKVGFAMDAGPAPRLTNVSADFRLERGDDSRLLVRADGRPLGTPVDSVQQAVSLMVDLAHWFVNSGGNEAGRVRRHHVPLPGWAPESAKPARATTPLQLGRHPLGAVFGLPLGRIHAAVLKTAVERSAARHVRVTPWRRLLLEGAMPQPLDGLISDNMDPRLSVDACPGAPYCEQASVATQSLAADLSQRIGSRLHVSGCSKGCATGVSAPICLVGRRGRFDLILDGRADGLPTATDLDPSDVCDYLESIDASRL